jgi:hypothetical protein
MNTTMNCKVGRRQRFEAVRRIQDIGSNCSCAALPKYRPLRRWRQNRRESPENEATRTGQWGTIRFGSAGAQCQADHDPQQYASAKGRGDRPGRIRANQIL